MRAWARSALRFTALGLCLYAALHAGSELLLLRTGHSHPLFRVRGAPASSDWVVLGASHAMPLGFGDVPARLSREHGLEVLVLASPGTGPLYNRFVLEAFLARHRAGHLLYVADAFAFHSAAWNEERFADAKLLRRTPLEAATAWRLAGYAFREGVEARALLDYLVGFSKINNRERFQRDAWEGESQFEKVHRPSASAVKKRIAYLYPDGAPEAARARYLDELDRLVVLAQRHGVRVVALKPPVPPGFARELPDEAGFDAALRRALEARGVPLHDLSASLPEPRWYFDSDHLNRAGVDELLARHLLPILEAGRAR